MDLSFKIRSARLPVCCVEGSAAVCGQRQASALLSLSSVLICVSRVLGTQISRQISALKGREQKELTDFPNETLVTFEFYNPPICLLQQAQSEAILCHLFV